MKNDKNIALVGIGPHAKRIYLNYLKKYKINLALVIELVSKEKETREYLIANGFESTKVFTIEDIYKDDEYLPNHLSTSLFNVCEIMDITHLLIATEPKGHHMFLDFALKNNINVLTDKPISVLKGMTNSKNINKIRKQYYDLIKLADNSSGMCNVMCQRQYHRGYEYIKNLLNDVVGAYKIPITYIDVYHCDGNWEMPHDMLKENHPYKYGYGKLFHSGYHFIDLLSDFIKINDQLSDTKKITKGKVYTNFFTPNDELAVVNMDDYKRLFKNQNIPNYYNENLKPDFTKFGEKNFYGMLKFMNSYNQTITNVNLNLLHYGFSRRGWIESKDFYKSNGRIRHERISIQVGTLMNIQIHSYQSKEIKDRLTGESEIDTGGLEHFDIDIYRNTDVIGGKAFERIKLSDLYTENDIKGFLGYNELSREEYLNNFISGKCEKGTLHDQALSIEILHSCALGLSDHYSKKDRSREINLNNLDLYPIQITELKKQSNKQNFDLEKKTISHYLNHNGKYEFGTTLNHIKKFNTYEVYTYVTDGNDIASGLNYKEVQNKLVAKVYFNFMKWRISIKSIKKIVEFISK